MSGSALWVQLRAGELASVTLGQSAGETPDPHITPQRPSNRTQLFERKIALPALNFAPVTAVDVYPYQTLGQFEEANRQHTTTRRH